MLVLRAMDVFYLEVYHIGNAEKYIYVCLIKIFSGYRLFGPNPSVRYSELVGMKTQKLLSVRYP